MSVKKGYSFEPQDTSRRVRTEGGKLSLYSDSKSSFKAPRGQEYDGRPKPTNLNKGIEVLRLTCPESWLPVITQTAIGTKTAG